MGTYTHECPERPSSRPTSTVEVKGSTPTQPPAIPSFSPTYSAVRVWDRGEVRGARDPPSFISGGEEDRVLLSRVGLLQWS